MSSTKTQSAAPIATLITPKEAPAPEPRVTRTGGEAAETAELAAPGALPSPATGEFAQLFSSESAAPFNKPLQFADVNPSTLDPSAEAEGIAQVGHRRAARKCRHGNVEGQCPEGCPAEIACPPAASCQTFNCPPVYYGGCPMGCNRVVFGNNCMANKLRCCSINHRMRTQQTSDTLAAMFHEDCNEKFNWFRCKFGYFFPSGSGGKGSAIAGHYSMVYPVNPGYQDPRDCGVYAAQGYNGPVAVPLAPVVHHTYNYGWGVPSSRLTPVSHPITGPYPY
ncbi:MAG TPA: hypothetical protein VM452_04895 [Caulifigura sp.]|nr:hypothetical protein [Caulifigura sp.]